MIIGLAGAKESGKNTAAQFIAEQFSEEYEVCEHSFAAKLKESACAAIGGTDIDPVEFCDKLKNEYEFMLFRSDDYEIDRTFTGREFLQWYGTEAHREVFDQDFWVGQVLDYIPNPVNEVGTTTEWNKRIDLITDVRFPNEAEAIKDCAGLVLRINRSEVETKDAHASEIPLDLDLVWAEIDNNGTLEEFKETLWPHVKYAIEYMEIK